MKFSELRVGDKFTVGNVQYQKVAPVKLTCCKLKKNAINLSNNADAVIDNNQEVKKTQ